MTTRTSGTRSWSGTVRSAVLFSGVVILSACDTAPDRSATDDYPVFNDEATEQDIPAMEHSENLSAEMELPAEEVRWVGNYDDTDFYATLGSSETAEDDQVLCFIVAAHELEVAGAACSTDPYDHTDPTVKTRVGATGGAVQAFLVPADTELEEADGWQRASDYVVVLTDPSAQPELTGTVADDTDIVLQRITG